MNSSAKAEESSSCPIGILATLRHFFRHPDGWRIVKECECQLYFCMNYAITLRIQWSSAFYDQNFHCKTSYFMQILKRRNKRRWIHMWIIYFLISLRIQWWSAFPDLNFHCKSSWLKMLDGHILSDKFALLCEIKKINKEVNTGKYLSEALIFASINTQWNYQFSTWKLQAQNMGRTYSEHVLAKFYPCSLLVVFMC